MSLRCTAVRVTALTRYFHLLTPSSTGTHFLSLSVVIANAVDVRFIAS